LSGDHAASNVALATFSAAYATGVNPGSTLFEPRAAERGPTMRILVVFVAGVLVGVAM
jgi:hypothetical protein